MRLSELTCNFPELKIMQDGEFNSTGSNDCVHEAGILSYIISKKYIKDLSENISCVITTDELAGQIPGNICIALSDKPKETFFKIHNSLSSAYKVPENKTIIGRNCVISPRALISDINVIIGDNVVIEENAVIKKDVIIGNGCVLRSGAIIGGEGYIFCEIDGVNTFVNHYGNIVIHDFVEVQYNTVVNKAIWKGDSTVIGGFSKLSVLVSIEHGIKIGKNCRLADGVIIGGNTIIGDNVFLGLNAMLKNHIKIGAGATVGMGAVVLSDVDEGATVIGNPARRLEIKETI